MGWLERRFRWERPIRLAHRWFPKASIPILVLDPSGFFSLLAGATGLSPFLFGASLLAGVALRLLAVRLFAETLRAPLLHLLQLIAHYGWPLLAFTLGVGLLQLVLIGRRALNRTAPERTR
jgi:hypothetical protein